MSTTSRALAASALVIALSGCVGGESEIGASPSPTPSATAARTSGANAFAPGPRVTCPGPGRPVYIDIAATGPRTLAFLRAKRGPSDSSPAATPEVALKRFVERNRTATGDPRYDVRYFSPIEFPQHYDKSERSGAARFAGYRANDSIFVILNLQRYNAESGWVQGTIETCTQPHLLPA